MLLTVLTLGSVLLTAAIGYRLRRWLGPAMRQNAVDARLSVAVAYEDLPEVRAALHAGANPNLKNYHDHPMLAEAAHMGNRQIVKALLDAGADIDATDGWGATALHWAVEGSYIDRDQTRRKADVETIRLLITRGADINRRTDYGKTPLGKALVENETNRAEVVALLKRYGARR